MVRRCLYSTNWLQLQHGMTKAHVEENRVQYRAKFDLFQRNWARLLPLQKPDAGFYYWLKVDNDETFAKMLMEKAHVKVLPGTLFVT